MRTGSNATPSRARVAPAHRALAATERGVKRPLCGCRMCGQCVLHSTGLTCPMTCPKQLWNGPWEASARTGAAR